MNPKAKYIDMNYRSNSMSPMAFKMVMSPPLKYWSFLKKYKKLRELLFKVLTYYYKLVVQYIIKIRKL